MEPSARPDRGSGRSRVQAFLLRRLQESTRTQYLQDLSDLNASCAAAGAVWEDLNEEEQDWWLAEYVIDRYESGAAGARSGCQFLLSALAKMDPRVKYKTAWKCMDVWAHEVPVRQAPAAPPELLTAVFVLAVALGKPALGVAAMLCFAGLLRVREALGLLGEHVIFSGREVVLVLGRTKRGLEQKVVISHPAAVSWVHSYFLRFPCQKHERAFPVAYSTVLSWLRRLSGVLGVGHLNLTTHSLRRSGASELSRRGVPMDDLLAYGRWLSPKAAREYVRRGEVAIIRASQSVTDSSWHRIRLWAGFHGRVWHLYDLCQSVLGAGPRAWRVGAKEAAVAALESSLFGYRPE